MNFFNIGTAELMVIIAIAILVVGPKRLVQVARTLGRMATRMRQISSEFTSIMRSELSELDEARQEVQAAVGELTGTEGAAAVSAEVGDAVDATKGDADKSMQPVVDGGLGLSQIASELRATASDARKFVEKAAAEEAAKTETAAAAATEAATAGPGGAETGASRQADSGVQTERVDARPVPSPAGEMPAAAPQPPDSDDQGLASEPVGPEAAARPASDVSPSGAQSSEASVRQPESTPEEAAAASAVRGEAVHVEPATGAPAPEPSAKDIVRSGEADEGEEPGIAAAEGEPSEVELRVEASLVGASSQADVSQDTASERVEPVPLDVAADVDPRPSSTPSESERRSPDAGELASAEAAAEGNETPAARVRSGRSASKRTAKLQAEIADPDPAARRQPGSEPERDASVGIAPQAVRDAESAVEPPPRRDQTDKSSSGQIPDALGKAAADDSAETREERPQLPDRGAQEPASGEGGDSFPDSNTASAGAVALPASEVASRSEGKAVSGVEG